MSWKACAVLQCAQCAGSGTRPRSSSAAAAAPHTAHLKNASRISGAMLDDWMQQPWPGTGPARAACAESDAAWLESREASLESHLYNDTFLGRYKGAGIDFWHPPDSEPRGRAKMAALGSGPASSPELSQGLM
ncbi:hypothetical protein MSG28_008840 [Choristoneura fumiferana]|uniref:Uncharacterized protein n=1 Tax=Choristoneura fumiferana TaxID=7141 RepID=A0ACC0J866_CHOFU|nr:hypothetical protein MSG28_008840 [Choristoneura fumiferana]